MRSLTAIANEAIADLPAHPITSLDDGSREAEECARFLPGIVSELLGYHDWEFVRRRVTLAEVTNDRPGEWEFAYAVPGQVASPIKLVRPESATGALTFDSGYGLSVYDVTVTPSLFWPTSQLPHAAIDYEIADGVLYTDLPGAIFEYSLDALEPSKWTALFAKAVIMELAARIYRPLLGEKADTNEVQVKRSMAMAYLNRAIADDLNRRPREREIFVAEGVAARLGATGGLTLWRR
jgi:hypothetical protein